jgi:hypothetical protein
MGEHLANLFGVHLDTAIVALSTDSLRVGLTQVCSPVARRREPIARWERCCGFSAGDVARNSGWIYGAR